MTESKKGRPTPKRKDAQSKTHTLAPVVTKEEKAKARAAAKAARIASREAFMRGDENALPARDRGPVRRFARDFVDARRSVGEFFLPIIFTVLVLTIAFPTQTDPKTGLKTLPITQYIAIGVMYAVLIISVIDGLLLSRKLKKAIKAKFPDASTRGISMYAWLRSTQMRKMRTPKPQHKAGTKLK